MTNIIPLTPILYDRSRVVTDWQCPRKRFYQYEYDGKGVVPATTQLELQLGIIIHDALAAIGHGVDIEDIAPAAQKQVYDSLMGMQTGDEYEADYFAKEQAALVEGLVRGFNRAVWPALMRLYPRILAVEKEMEFRHDELGNGSPTGRFLFMSRPDVVLASENEEEVVYVEYKSTSTKKESWLHSWNTAVQLHSTMRAIEATLGVKPTSVIVQGLYKGYESYGKQNSPFCYAYSRGGNPPFSLPENRYDYAAGFRRFPSWQLDGGVRKWVEGMPDEVLAAQFPCTPPIFINEDLVDKFFAQRARREGEIDEFHKFTETDEKDLDAVFPQKFDQCLPAWGWGCTYRQFCFGRVGNPLEQGYAYREPHHAPETAQRETT